MANTYSQIYIQLVFAVKYRQSLILPEWEPELYKYISGIIQNQGQKLYAINGTPNHIHIFLSLAPDCAISDLVCEIKRSSTNYVNEHHWSRYLFKWQEGFGAFSYHISMADKVVRYVMNQKEHHKTKAFREEYIDLLNVNHIDYDDRYVLRDI